jgi:hypothetical protein
MMTPCTGFRRHRQRFNAAAACRRQFPPSSRVLRFASAPAAATATFWSCFSPFFIYFSLFSLGSYPCSKLHANGFLPCTQVLYVLIQ